MTGLIERFRAALRGAGATPGHHAAEVAGADLLARWGQPHRHYHTVGHLVDVLSVVDTVAPAVADRDVVRLAAWYHDAVYDPRATSGANERDSAALARRMLERLGLPGPTVAEVERLVLLTAGHAAEAGDANGSLLCDADLGVLAAPPDRYNRYVAAIRRECLHVPEDAFRAGRAEVLRRLLGLPTLYRLPVHAARWERPARANLRRELAALTAAGT